jgi:hypothetical protein
MKWITQSYLLLINTSNDNQCKLVICQSVDEVNLANSDDFYFLLFYLCFLCTEPMNSLKQQSNPLGKVASNLDHTWYLSPTLIDTEILYAPKKLHKQPNMASR